MLSEKDRAIKLAQQLYQQKKQQGVDLDSGPCLSEEIMPDWCVDIAHNPRQPIDNRRENQCSSFREGRVRHCVELDPDGNLIRTL